MDTQNYQGIFTDGEKAYLKSDIERTPLNNGELRVKVFSAPVNPSDYRYASGRFYIKGKGPVGFEGAGEIVEAANDVD